MPSLLQCQYLPLLVLCKNYGAESLHAFMQVMQDKKMSQRHDMLCMACQSCHGQSNSVYIGGINQVICVLFVDVWDAQCMQGQADHVVVTKTCTIMAEPRIECPTLHMRCVTQVSVVNIIDVAV